VIHRDIKPGNLFLCDTGQVKVTDFGIARAASGTTLSAAGSLVGTFAYMPPEQWRGAAPAFSNDVWAAGCVLYRLISGRPPRVFPDAAGYAAAAMRGDPVPDLRDISDAPDWLASAVMAMLDPDPARRPAAADCVRLLSGMPSMASASPPPALGQASFGQLPLNHTYPAQSSPGQPGVGWAEPGPVGAGAGQPPTTVVMPPPAAASTADRRPRRRTGLVVTAIAGVVALLVAGSLIALRFYGSPQSSGTAAGATSAPPSPSAATTPTTSAAASRTGTATASAPARPTGSTSASSAAAPATSATASAPASTAPALVPVPDVVGMTFAKARAVLIDDGFRVVGSHPRVGQTVTSTSPSGQAPAGSVIIVVYGTGL